MHETVYVVLMLEQTCVYPIKSEPLMRRFSRTDAKSNLFRLCNLSSNNSDKSWLKSGICLSIAPVPVHCFSITFF